MDVNRAQGDVEVSQRRPAAGNQWHATEALSTTHFRKRLYHDRKVPIVFLP